MGKLAKQFFATVVPAVLKPLQVIWNQIIAFLFLSLAVLVGFRTWPSVKQFDGEPADLIKLILSVFFALLMTGYGVHALLRARKIAKR